MKLPKEKEDKFYTILKDITRNSRFSMCKEFTQHGDTSVWEHCVQVAHTAYALAHKFNIEVSESELIRGALLHDYFLYDWHENNLPNKIHGFTHPRKACKEALKDFELSKREQDMILHHMFPLTPMPPRYREGFLLCLADKMCATNETVDRRNKHEKRRKRLTKIRNQRHSVEKRSFFKKTKYHVIKAL